MSSSSSPLFSPMAASEVAVSLAIVRLHDLLSKSEDIILSKRLKDQIYASLSELRKILNTRKDAEVNDEHSQETQGDKNPLLLCVHAAEQRELQIVSVMNRVSSRKKMAKDFMTMFGFSFSKFTSSARPARDLPDNESASSLSSSKRNPENTRQRVESDIVSRDKYVEDLRAWLIEDRDSNLRVISVVGARGCGKTALVRGVFNELKVKHHFDCRAWVRFTGLWAKKDQMKNLMLDILKQIPLGDRVIGLDCKQEEELFKMLYRSLMDLRYLIVVDNLHEARLINNLLVPFVDSIKGSRVIVTTDITEMQKFADPWTRGLSLPELTERETEELLRVSILGEGDSVDKDLESKMTIFKERTLSKCNGSPAAISLLGGLSSAAGASNFEALINRLGECPTRDSLSFDDVTRLSFDELPHMMKLCVLHMAHFPKESEVPTRRLLRQWAAEGLLAEAAADGSVQMRLAEDCFHDLESRNFIHVVRRKLDGSARSCRMPAILHEFFCPEAKETRLSDTQPSRDSVVSKESIGKDPHATQSAQCQQKQGQNTATGHNGPKVQCLRSFAVFNTRKLGTPAEEIKTLLESELDGRQELLRVLDLENVYKPVLPKDFGNKLPNLRYLGLRGTVLDSIPESVGNLLLLETLDLKHTNITKVTSAIWNAKNLRHLYLSEASFDKSIRLPISSTKLETLWGLLIATAGSDMIGVLGELKSLKKLGVTCCPGAVKAVTKNVRKLTSLKSLRLRSRDLLGQPASLDLSMMQERRDKVVEGAEMPEETGHDMPSQTRTSISNLYLVGSLEPKQDPLSVLPKKLEVLTLSMSELEEDPLKVLRSLENLIVLRLLARSYTGIISGKAVPSLTCTAGFPKLRILKMWKLDNLEILEFKRGDMCKLEELDIRQCEKLQAVEGLNCINSLKSVLLTRVDEVLPKRIKFPEHTLVKKKDLGSKLRPYTQRYWVDEELNKSCLMVLAKGLQISPVDVENDKSRIWIEEKKPCCWGDETVPVAELKDISRLEIRGKCENILLSPMTMYEVAVIAKMSSGSTGWGTPVILSLEYPDGKDKQLGRKEILDIMEKEKWIPISIGKFETSPNTGGEISFSLTQTDEHKKSGLRVKGVVFMPTTENKQPKKCGKCGDVFYF